MSPKQLMLAALRLQPVERVPVATYNFHPFGGFANEDAYQPMLDALAGAEHVGVLCKCGPSRKATRGEETKTESRNEGDAVVTTSRLETPKGELRSVHKTPKDQPGYCMEPFLKTDDDIEKLLSLPAEPGERDLSAVKAFSEQISDKGLAYVGYSDPFYAVAHWFDFEDFAIRCLSDLSALRALVEREFVRIKAELAQILEQARGYEFLFHTAGPELATPPMLPPRVFDELVTPFERELVKMIKDAGQLSSIHCHGRVGTLLDRFLGVGCDVLEPLEPPPQGDIALDEALAHVDARMCLMGYIQDQDLHLAKPGEMREKVEWICQAAKGKTGYIMTPTATPFMHPPSEEFVRNYLDFLRTAQESG